MPTLAEKISMQRFRIVSIPAGDLAEAEVAEHEVRVVVVALVEPKDTIE